jgi:hypothetical protein
MPITDPLRRRAYEQRRKAMQRERNRALGLTGTGQARKPPRAPYHPTVGWRPDEDLDRMAAEWLCRREGA